VWLVTPTANAAPHCLVSRPRCPAGEKPAIAAKPTIIAVQLRAWPPDAQQDEQILNADVVVAVEVGGAAFARSHRLFSWKAVRTCRIGEMKRCQDYFLGRKRSKNSS